MLLLAVWGCLRSWPWSAAPSPPTRVVLEVHGCCGVDMDDGWVRPVESAAMGLTGVVGLRAEVADEEGRIEVLLEPDVDPFEVTRALHDAAVGSPLEGVDWRVFFDPGDSVRRILVLAGPRDLQAPATATLERRLLETPGVWRIERCGEAEPELTVRLDPALLAARVVGPAQVAAALRPGDPESVIRTEVAPGLTVGDLGTVERRFRPTRCRAIDAGGAAVTVLEVVTAPTAAIPVPELQGLLPPDLALSERVGRVHASTLGAADQALPRAAAVLGAVPGGAEVVLIGRPGGELQLVGTGASGEAFEDALARVPGVVPIPLDGWTVRLTADEHGALVDPVGAVSARLAGVEGVRRVGAGAHTTTRLEVELDRDRAARLGITPADLAEAVRAVVEGLEVRPAPGLAIDARQEHPLRVRVGADPDLTAPDPAALGAVTVVGPAGVATLGDLAEIRLGASPVRLRVDGRPAAEIGVRAPGDPNRVEARLAGAIAEVELPAGVAVAVVPPGP